MAARLPEDLVSLFAVAARDVLWFKDKLMRVFRRAGVPEALVLQLERQKKEPTVKLCQQLLDNLEQRGDQGERVVQALFTTVADWQDLTHLEGDKQRVARRRQADLKNAIRSWADRERYRVQKEKDAQREREERVKVSPSVHANAPPQNSSGHQNRAVRRSVRPLARMRPGSSGNSMRRCRLEGLRTHRHELSDLLV